MAQVFDTQRGCETFDAAEGMFRSPRMFDEGASAIVGDVRWSAAKSVWIGGLTVAALVLGPMYFTLDAFALFIVTTGVTVCLGHSLGMHRRLIHRSYDCPLWLERLFVYLGTLVGMGGPTGMICQHDVRDWAQRKSNCHAFLAHRSSMMKDAWWQMHCELHLAKPPRLVIEDRVRSDAFYLFLDRTWAAQQLPWAVLFFAIGGLPWLVWGIACRVVAAVMGHWLIGYLAHNRGPRSWHVDGVAVQGYNVTGCGLITMGEAWHNNHHAYPGSARLGLKPGEWDPGWWVLCGFERLGLVWDVNTPETLPARDNVRAVSDGEKA